MASLDLLDFHSELEKESVRLPNMEHMLGKTAMQPFANTNSGSRKIMFEIQLEHALGLINPEVPIVQTGYEIRYGDKSSSIVDTENELEIIDKISKFETHPNHHYCLITRDLKTGEFSYIERKLAKHSTESYGFLYNNSILDSLEPSFVVEPETILRKSFAFDEYMNRCDGVNLLAGYIGSDKTMEDGIQVSRTAAKKLMSPLIKEVKVIINDNDLLLNLFGNDSKYKSFPDIGEEIEGGILCAVRREKIEECLYMQSIDLLNQVLMSDDKFTVEGRVIDISVYCNNPDTLEDKYSNSQVVYYYKQHQKFNMALIERIEAIWDEYGHKVPMSSKLKKLYYEAIKEGQGNQFIWDKPFSGTAITFYIMEENIPKKGDKITNRYGGKGVISEIIEDELMPMLDDGNRLEVCFNSSTCVNRLNPGQLMETSLTFIGSRLLEYISSNLINRDDAVKLIYKYLSFISKKQADYFMKTIYDDSNDPEDIDWFIDDMISDGYIIVSNLPMSESMTLDILNEMYKAFPFIRQYTVESKIKGSDGNYRSVPGRRSLVCGKMYIYRLKQYAEEKFSVTSLSSTNIKNENTRNKANKNFKALHTNTPIRFGEMETGDFMHMDAEHVVSNLMIHSVSPQARRLVESALTGNPYHVDIVLNSDSKNRSVEILNAYLKTMGLRLVFIKTKKKMNKLMTKKLMVKICKKKVSPLMVKINQNESSTRVFGKTYGEFAIEQHEKYKSHLMHKYLMKKITPDEKKEVHRLMTKIYKED